MENIQPGIMLPVPTHARYLTFALKPGCDHAQAAQALSELDVDETLVVGLGQSLVMGLGQTIEGLRPFPTLIGPGVDIPATPAALWCWLRGNERGDLVHRTRDLDQLFSPSLRLDQVVDGFMYDKTPDGLGRDLTGYEDGTENPDGEEALNAAVGL